MCIKSNEYLKIIFVYNGDSTIKQKNCKKKPEAKIGIGCLILDLFTFFLFSHSFLSQIHIEFDTHDLNTCSFNTEKLLKIFMS